MSQFLEFNDPVNYTVSSQEGRRQRVSQLPELNVLSSAQNNLRKQKRKGQSAQGVKCPVNHTEQSQEKERTKSQSTPGVKCQSQPHRTTSGGRRQRVSQLLELNVLSTAQNNIRKAEDKESVSSWSLTSCQPHRTI